MLRAEGAPDTVIFHCFSSGAAMARTCVDEGWVLSLSGHGQLQERARAAGSRDSDPAGQLLVETDAPFLTPHPYRGAPNEPYCLPYTVRAWPRSRLTGPAERHCLGKALRHGS